ncbi:MAG: hypothetical protein GC136_08105 [Alphaproteobacteria bacterium]|nr:hypothetical protein [Alphaproteobacteria bacterium]
MSANPFDHSALSPDVLARITGVTPQQLAQYGNISMEDLAQTLINEGAGALQTRVQAILQGIGLAGDGSALHQENIASLENEASRKRRQEMSEQIFSGTLTSIFAIQTAMNMRVNIDGFEGTLGQYSQMADERADRLEAVSRADPNNIQASVNAEAARSNADRARLSIQTVAAGGSLEDLSIQRDCDRVVRDRGLDPSYAQRCEVDNSAVMRVLRDSISERPAAAASTDPIFNRVGSIWTN